MQFNSITTLNEIREHSPCSEGWQKLLAEVTPGDWKTTQ